MDSYNKILTLQQEKVLELIIKKEKELDKIRFEINNTLRTNNLKGIDVDEYQRKQKVEEYARSKRQ